MRLMHPANAADDCLDSRVGAPSPRGSAEGNCMGTGQIMETGERW